MGRSLGAVEGVVAALELSVGLGQGQALASPLLLEGPPSSSTSSSREVRFRTGPGEEKWQEGRGQAPAGRVGAVTRAQRCG